MQAANLKPDADKLNISNNPRAILHKTIYATEFYGVVSNKMQKKGNFLIK